MSVAPNGLPKNLGFHGIVILLNIRYTVGYLNKVLCSYESVGLNVQAKHKK